MDILIPDKWLREFLSTKATTHEIAQNLSLCGPSVERINEVEGEPVYDIEITTNRIDTAGVFGIAREAAAILPEFKIKAELLPIKLPKIKFSRTVKYLTVKIDPKLCKRFTAVLIKNVKVGASSALIQKRLKQVGIRPINNVVDISNYLMVEMGQPVHTFDWDKIEGHKMIVRESKKDEELITLDGKTHKLPGGDIVIEDGSGSLIDLAGIMGGENSSVSESTKNVLLFVQTYDPVRIRKTSMTLAHRTQAATIFEKGIDTELVGPTILRGIEMFEKIGGKAEKEILDVYSTPYKPKTISVSYEFINRYLGVSISKENVTRILSSLGFDIKWKGENVVATIPSWRANDIEIEQDLIEEVARIYGYHNLPSIIMNGALPETNHETPFKLETKIKQTLKGFGGAEVYTLSLVAKEETSENSLKLKNPLGSDSEYLRTSLMPSLLKAAKENSFEKDSFHIFEIANVYLPKKDELPEERMTLAGIFGNTSFRESKGIVESLLSELNIEFKTSAEDSRFYVPSQRIVYKSSVNKIGELGVLENGQTYYEFPIQKLNSCALDVAKFKDLPKYPPQIEDITVELPEKTKIGELIDALRSSEKVITGVSLQDVYQNSYTFRIHYQDSTKTLTDKDIEVIRPKVIRVLENKFGGKLNS